MVLSAGCPAAAPPASAPTRPAQQAPAPSPEAAPVLTAQKLEAFLRYQRRWSELEAGLLAELAPLAAQLKAARSTSSRAGSRALALVERRARAEEEARQAEGLSEAEVQAFRSQVEAVLAPRRLARELGLADTLQALEEGAGSLQGPKRAELEALLAPLREQRATLEGLAAERAQLGDAVVELVLSREEELVRLHEETLRRLAGEGRPRAPAARPAGGP